MVRSSLPGGIAGQNVLSSLKSWARNTEMVAGAATLTPAAHGAGSRHAHSIPAPIGGLGMSRVLKPTLWSRACAAAR